MQQFVISSRIHAKSNKGVCVCIELTFDRMTVGKIYAGLLIAENWKAFKANKGTGADGSNAAVVSNLY